MREKIIVGALSAMLSGGLTVALNNANTAGRLDGIERAVIRIENRLDSMQRPQEK